MNKILYSLLIPLVLCGQEVYSAAYNQGYGTYSTMSSSYNIIQNNNVRLRNNVCEYNEQLQNTMQKLQRTPCIYGEENNSTPVPWGLGENSQNIQQHEQASPSDNTLQIQRETPNWWRQEGSYQGWGFN